MVEKIEQGSRVGGKVTTLQAIAQGLGVELAVLLAPAGTSAPGSAAGAAAAVTGPQKAHPAVMADNPRGVVKQDQSTEMRSSTTDRTALTDDESLAPLFKSLSDLLSSLRNGVGWTQQELADRIGYGRTTVAVAETAASADRMGSESFWESCDTALAADGVLLQAYSQIAAVRASKAREQAWAAEQARQQRIAKYRATPLAGSPKTVSPMVPLPLSSENVPSLLPERTDIHAISVEDLADDEVNRRELLRLITVAGSLIAASEVERRFEALRSGFESDDPETLEEFERLNLNLWSVFSLSRSKALAFPLVREQLEVLTTALENSTSGPDHRRLCLLLGDLFQLAGEVLFDLNRYTDAAHCYSLAATASREAQDNDLWSCALTRHAFISIYDRRFKTAIPLLDAASRVAKDGDPMLSTRYWVSVVKAEALAGLGEFDACRRALDHAEKVRELSGDFQNGGWLRFDGSRLAEERGRCYVELGRSDLAEAALTDALKTNLSARRRGSVLSDLAVIGIQERDRDKIVYYAGQAVQLAEQTRSGVLAKKLASIRASLAPLAEDSEVRNLDDRIGALAVSNRRFATRQ